MSTVVRAPSEKDLEESGPKKYELIIYAEAASKSALAGLIGEAAGYLRFGSGNGRYSDSRGFIEYQAKPVKGEIRDTDGPYMIPYIRTEMQVWDDEERQRKEESERDNKKGV